MNNQLKCDYSRYNKMPIYIKRLLKHFRLCKNSKFKMLRLYHKFWFYYLSRKHCIEISSKTKIGKGLFIGHPYCITINGDAVIGDYCNIHKGVLIGQENRGKRKGTPVIGNNVWIGINSAIVGKVNIGNDVLIAPNTFVNCDIPSHSVVFGNPCIIKNKIDATKYYINNAE